MPPSSHEQSTRAAVGAAGAARRHASAMWPRAVLTWVLIIGAEVVHGILRGLLLVPVVGMHRAGQIGVLIGSALVLGIAWLTRRWRDGASTRSLLGVGALWAMLTVIFEFAFGYYVIGYSLAYIAGDFNPLAGRLMLFGLLLMLFAPRLVARRPAAAAF